MPIHQSSKNLEIDSSLNWYSLHSSLMCCRARSLSDQKQNISINSFSSSTKNNMQKMTTMEDDLKLIEKQIKNLRL